MSYYHILSSSGKVVQRFRTLEAAAKEIKKRDAWQSWGIARESRGKSVMLSREEQAIVRSIRHGDADT